MSTTVTTLTVFGMLTVAILSGRGVRSLLPEHHLGADTRDAIKLATGLVATMTALLLGLLVSSARGTFDSERMEVIQMAAKISFLGRVLELYGSEAADARSQLHSTVEHTIRQIWPEDKSALPLLSPETEGGSVVFGTIERLSSKDDSQRSLKAEAVSLALDLGQMRSLLVAQATPSVSRPLVDMVVCWLVVIFLSFSLVAPPNATATLSLLVSALAASAAIFLILELDRPFGGLIQISSQPMLNALNHLPK